MPAYSILAWLRRRRAVTRGVWRPTDAFRSAFSAFTGRRHSPRPPLLLPPADWRERLSRRVADRYARPIVAEMEIAEELPRVAEVEQIVARPAIRRAGRVDEPRVRERPVEPLAADASIDEETTLIVDDRVVRPEAVRLGVDAPLSRERTTPEPEAPTSPQEVTAPRTVKSSVPPTSVPSREPRQQASVDDAVVPRPRTSLSVAAPSQTRANDVRPTATSRADAAVEDAKPAVDATSAMPAEIEPGASPTRDREPARSSDDAVRELASPPLPSVVESRPGIEPSSAARPVGNLEPEQRVLQAEQPAQPRPAESDVAQRVETVRPPSRESAAPVETTVPPAASMKEPPAPSAPERRARAPIASDSVVVDTNESLISKVELPSIPLPTEPARAGVDDAFERAAASAEVKDEPIPAAEAREESDVVAVPAAPTLATREPAPSFVEPRSPASNDVPGAIRPTEERRSRRSRPAAPKSPTESTSKAAAKPEPRETPRVAEEAREPEPVAERSMFDWRRLLFEATSDPQPRPARKPGPPERAGEKTATSPAVELPTFASPAAPTPPAEFDERSIETEPLLESTRRFLRPRVGFDPATVPVVRGPMADRLVRNVGADAAAVADAIVLPSSHDERSPATRALIAHELTHVAQRREPRFIPPSIKSTNVFGRQSPSTSAFPHSEEQLARRVERSVWNDAELSEQAESDPFANVESLPQAFSPRGHYTSEPQRDASEWGNLPAPWEPLPMAAVSEPAASLPSMAVSTGEQTVHYAEHGRTLEGGEQAAPSHAAHPEAAPPPDLDALARRVYDVLKRRLAAERRREG